MLAPVDLVTDRFRKFVTPFTSFRTYQLETALKVKAAFERGVKLVLLQAPTGVGKTLIAVLVAAMMELRLIYTCHSKQLQSQFCTDFPDAVELLGRNNYICLKNPKLFPQLSAELCTYSSPYCKTCVLAKEGCEPDIEGKCPCRSDCPYILQKKLALAADIAVLNTAYFLREANWAGGFSNIPLLVLDEVDLVENALLSMVEVSFGDRFLEKFMLPRPKFKTKPESWKEWAPVCLEQVNQKIKALEYAWGIDDLVSLHQLEQKRRQLQFFIKEVDDRWVFDGITFKPVWINRYAGKYLFQHADRVLGLSATISPWQQLVHDLGVPRSEVEFIDTPSVFPVDRRPIYYQPVADMGHKSKDAEFPKLITAIDRILDNHLSEKGLIHCVSYANANYIIGGSRHRRRMITHGQADRKSQLYHFKNSTQSKVLLSPSAERGIDLPDEDCRFIIIAKTPFPNLGDAQISARVYRSKADGQRWYNAATARRIVQATGRGMRSADDYCTSYILDSAFGDFYQENLASFPRWWRDALIMAKGGDAIEA